MTARIRQIAWTAWHLQDIESDLSVFHGVSDLKRLSGPRFFSLAYRLGAYQGVVAARARAQQAKRPARVPMNLSDWSKANPDAIAAAMKAREENPGVVQGR